MSLPAKIARTNEHKDAVGEPPRRRGVEVMGDGGVAPGHECTSSQGSRRGDASEQHPGGLGVKMRQKTRARKR